MGVFPHTVSGFSPTENPFVWPFRFPGVFGRTLAAICLASLTLAIRRHWYGRWSIGFEAVSKSNHIRAAVCGVTGAAALRDFDEAECL